MTVLRKTLIWIGLIGIVYLITLLPEFIYYKFGIAVPLPEDPLPDIDIISRILMGAVMAPVVEEFIFRGPVYLATKIKDSVNKRIYWLIILSLILFWSGLAFGLLHLTNFDGALPANIWLYVVAIVWDGLIWGFLTLTTKSLLPSIAVHSINNLIAILQLI